MDNVLPFPPAPKEAPTSPQEAQDAPERLVLVCVACGCRSFYHYADSSLECANCDLEIKATIDGPDDPCLTAWRRVAPEVTDDIPDLDSYNLSVKLLGNHNLAKASVLSKCKKWGDELVAVFAFKADGEGSHWNGVETREQCNWLMEKLKGVMNHMEKSEYTK